MHTWFATLGLDYRQWLALTRVFVKKDFRQSAMSTTLRHGQTGRRTFWVLIFFYFITGLIFVPIILSVADLFLGVTLLTSYTMFMIGGLILVEYHTVIVSPDDYAVLSYQPVSSTTFFFVKLTNMLFYVLIYSSVLALPAIITLMLKTTFQPGLALVAFSGVFLANITAALAIVMVYTAILNRVNYQRLQNILALFQVALAFLVYTSFFIIPKLLLLLSEGQYGQTVARGLYWLPSAWFSSYVRLATGVTDSLTLVMAGGSVVLVMLLGLLVIPKLSLGYAETMTRLMSRPQQRHAKGRLANLFRFLTGGHEERIVSKLIRNQFLRDNKFKMGVLGIVPLTIFYLLISVSDGPLPNPFVTHKLEMTRTGLLYLLIFLFPMMLRTYVTTSDAFRASWIFYSAPANLTRLIIAEKNFLMIYFVLPFLFILSLVFYYYFNNLLHVLLHTLVLGLLAHLFLQLAFIYSPDLPFSRPNIKGGKSRNMLAFLVLMPFVLFLGLPWIFEYVYAALPSMIIFILTAFVVSILLEKLIAVRITMHMKKFEFSG